VLKNVLEQLGKNADIYSVDGVGYQYGYLDPTNAIKKTDPNKVDFSHYDVLFALDVNNLERFGIITKINFKGQIINIDHHEESGFGDINIIDTKAGATCALLYYLFKDWNTKFDNFILNLLLIAVVADGGVFIYTTTSQVFRTVADLIEDGADYPQAIFNINQRYDIMVFKFWGDVIDRMQIDSRYRFVYSIIPYSVIQKYKPFGVRTRQVVDGFMRDINGTDFCVALFEDENGFTKVSVRSRNPKYYVLDLIKKLGGGGHLTGGGVNIKRGNFTDICDEVLAICRLYAEEHKADALDI
jgi:phosphoesterase RecJ-like protein